MGMDLVSESGGEYQFRYKPNSHETSLERGDLNDDHSTCKNEATPLDPFGVLPDGRSWNVSRTAR